MQGKKDTSPGLELSLDEARLLTTGSKPEIKSSMESRMQRALFSFLWLGVGFLLYPLVFVSPAKPEISAIRAEIVILELKSLVGDSLKVSVSGPARILWAENKIIDTEGEHLIPLGQLPDNQDLKFKQFFYTGNAKTGKFYPSSSYPARGTAIRDRRFFQTKQEAIAAGFIATKLVK